MKAAIIDKLGNTPYFGDFEEPFPANGQQRIEVRAASIKQLDKAIVRGTHYASPQQLPVVCGTDGVGVLNDGSRVFFLASQLPFGSMAQYSLAAWSVPIPDALEDTQVAALMNPAIGAWLPLSWRGNLAQGENVLVLGATGATGKLAVKIARLLGAKRVYAAGRMSSGLADVEADELIDTNLPPDDLRQAFITVANAGIDVVVDYLWGKPAEILINVLTGQNLAINTRGAQKGIRFVSVGELAGSHIALPSAVLRSSHLHILGSGTGNFPPLETLKTTIEQILASAISGELHVATEVMKLADVTNAWNLKTSKRIVLIP